MTRSNILFMIADDHRHSALGALGTEAVSTPTFDRLIADGVCFTQAHIMGSTSGAVCMPSRGMLMSGRHLFDTPDPLPDDIPLLPELLRENGYTTFGAGKWHNRRGSYARCFGESGKVFFGGMNDQFAMPVNDFDPAGEYPPEETYIADGYSTTVFCDDMINFLNTRDANDDDPFFAYIAFTSPHDPRTPPAPYDTMYDPADIELPPNFLPEHPFDIGVRDIRDEVLAGYPRGEDEIKRHIADYYGMISHMDMDIGRILDTLAARGLSENTIVIYTSDHGLGVGQHGLMGKQNLYDHSMRIPLIMRGPGLPAGLRSSALLYLHDLYPTLLQIAGIDIPKTSAGHSLVNVLSQATNKHRKLILSAYQGVFGHPEGKPYQRSVKDERHKLIQTVVDGAVTWQLFDLVADPYEQTDLIDRPGYESVSSDLKTCLRARQSRANDPLLTETKTEPPATALPGATLRRTTMTNDIRVDGARLWDSIMAMAEIGATVNGGSHRLTLSDEDKVGRDLFASWCADAGLTMTVDEMGDMFALRSGADASRAPVGIGSHLDTQPFGGRFDGVFGVLAGLEVIRTLNDHGINTVAPLEVVNWTNEEGARFAPAMLASGVYGGVFELDWAQSRQAVDSGATVLDELKRIGYHGDASIRDHEFSAFFECHIEQGPILDAGGISVGVVNAAQGFRWYDVSLEGFAQHTGSTPMVGRRNALLGMARVVQAVDDIAREHAPLARGTVGSQVEVGPGSRNVIPGVVNFTVDMRHPSADTLAAMDAALRQVCAETAADIGLQLSLEQISYTAPVAFDARCVAAVKSACERLGVSHQAITSGAGHDACYVANRAPATMLFAPCKDGISHHESESAEPDDLEAVCNVLLHAVLDIAGIAD